MSINHVRARVGGRAVIAAWGERPSGPGWSNSLVWFLLRNPEDGKLELECLQPDEQSAAMVDLLSISELVTSKLAAQVKAHLLTGGRKKSTP